MGPEGSTARSRRLDASGWAILAAPIVVDPWAFDPYLPLRFTVLALAVTVGVLTVGRALATAVPRSIVMAWAALLGVAVVAAMRAPIPLESWIGDSGRRSGVLGLGLATAAFLVGAAVRDRLTTTLRAAPVLLGVIGVAIGVDLAAAPLSASRSVLVGNAGHLGGYLVVLTGLAAVVARRDPHRWWRRGATTAIALGVLSTVLTGSHAAVTGLVVLAILWAVSADLAPLSSRVRAALLVGAGILAAAALSWTDQFRVLATSWRGRIDTWAVAWDAILTRPWFGWGPDGFRHGFAQHVSPGFVARYGDDRVTDRAHAVLLELPAALGLVGTVVGLVLLVLVVRHTERSTVLARGVLRTLLAAAAFLLVWFPSLELAVLLAWLAGSAVRSPSPHHEHDAPMRAPFRHLVLAATVSVAVASVGIGAASVVIDRQLRSALAASPTTEAARNPVEVAAHPLSGVTALFVAVPTVVRQGDPRQIEQARAAVFDARDAERMTLYGDLTLASATVTPEPELIGVAVGAYERALTLAPNHSPAWLGLGEALVRAGDDRATEVLRSAAELRPTDVAPRFNLAVFAHSRGDVATATRWLAEACELDAEDPQVRRLLEIVRPSAAPPACDPLAPDETDP